MRFCINYLTPKDMPEFFNLLEEKMEFNGVLVANPGAASGILNKVN
jgi:hypothetical protein